MKHYRQTTSCWLIAQALCFCLLLQGSGIAQALPLPPKQTFVSQAELEATIADRSGPGSNESSPKVDGGLSEWLGAAWSFALEAGESFGSRVRSPWSPTSNRSSQTIQIARAGGVLPLPPRLMSAVLASTGRGQAGPPRPPGMASELASQGPAAGIAGLDHKDATEEIQLLAGYNLISLPEEPADSSPAAVFAAVAPQLERVEAYDACDTADPWKLYDPADPVASDLTVADHETGMWVKTTAAALLPSDGILPATTTLQLCEGWNLIGFPAGQPRHPLAALASIAGKWQRLFAYDVFDSQDPWEVYDPAVPDWANDLQLMHPGRGYWLLASEATTLEIRNQGPPPIVAITSPADLAVITEPTEVLGTVDSDRMDNWTLTYRQVSGGNPVTLATGTAPVSGGTLATLDTTLLRNGLYEIELTATDVQGQQVSEAIAISVEGQMKIGHFTLTYLDLAVPVSGLDIEILRSYDSRDKQPRDFGIGWQLDIRQGSYVNNRAPGDGWQLTTGFLPCDTVLESKSHLTVVRLSDREVYRFALRLENGVPSTGGGCFANARFDFIDGPVPGATLEILGESQVFYEAGSDRVIDVDTLGVYEPEDVRLTTRDGRIFDLDLNAGVTRLEDLNGNQLSITPAGISHSSGKGIAFDRDAEGRIIGITDPLGRAMSYAYDAAGDLVSFTDRGSATTLFTYDSDHLLLDIEDPRGLHPVRNEYDDAGRLVRHIDAFGQVIELGHDRDNRRDVITDRLGASRVLKYDARGNVVREVDELGKETIRTFDGRDNLLTERDPLGRTTTFTYTSNDDLATVTDPLDNTTTYTYDSRGRLLTATDPRDGTSTRVYDASGNLTSNTDALGNVSSFSYDPAGNLLTATDATSAITTYDFDAFGNQTNVIDALGNETVSTFDANGNRLTATRTRTLPDGSTEALTATVSYDALGRVTTATAADGSTTSLGYDALGKVTSRIDAVGRLTSMTYDGMGRLVQVDHPDGTTESQTHDTEGRLISQTDRAGQTTTFAYDAAGRLITTTLAGGATTSSIYDDAGRMAAMTDALGNVTTFTYDAAGRRSAVIDPLGNGPSFTYDSNSNESSMTDARGHAVGFTYDSINRLIATTFPDGSTTEAAYDALGRVIRETDQAGQVTELVYDVLGRLISFKDALEQVTGYTYDEVGNRLTQTDANGHTTRFEHDRLGRLTARVLPDGARETMTYNVDSTLASHVDFNGATRTFEYDANRRLTRRTHPDGSEVQLTYTPVGQRATVTDTRGTTSYAYDNRHRLVEKTDPTGYKLGYGYDLQGNRTSLTATVGAQVFTATYGYDSLNRLATVTDSPGGVTSLAYDANGNRASLAFPNGVTTDYSYDPQNRLIHQQAETGIGDVLQSYALTLGVAGQRTRIDEHDGTSRHYAYDPLYRLTQDRVTDASAALAYQRDYLYDPVGNRLQETIEEGSGPTVISSTYDDRDRLLTAAGTSYGWDANGNLASKTGGGVTGYQWDTQNRMTSANLDDGTVVETTYDAFGNRVRTTLTPPAGATSSIDYLVDDYGPLSHVVAEIVGGAVQTLYTRADDQLIGLYRPASDTARYYHADGLGSIRALSDETGSVTDRYTYAAFGELLDHGGSDPQPYLFAGEPFDPNVGFYYNRARWLDVTAGRFIGQDPYLGASSDPKSLHRYLYASDPVLYVDPSGLSEYSVVSLSQLGTMLGVLAFSMVVGIALDHFFEITITLGLVWLGLAEREMASSIAFSVVFVAGFLLPDPSDLAKVRHVGKFFSKTPEFANSFRHIYPNGFRRKIPGTSDVATVPWGWTKNKKGQGMEHILHRHVPDYWAGYFKKSNSQFPQNTTGTDVLKYIDEGIKIKGDKLVPGKWNDIDYGDGRMARMFVDKDFNIMGFHPTTWPGSFEMKETYNRLKLLVP